MGGGVLAIGCFLASSSEGASGEQGARQNTAKTSKHQCRTTPLQTTAKRSIHAWVFEGSRRLDGSQRAALKARTQADSRVFSLRRGFFAHTQHSRSIGPVGCSVA